jgi:hypothetical protein
VHTWPVLPSSLKPLQLSTVICRANTPNKTNAEFQRNETRYLFSHNSNAGWVHSTAQRKQTDSRSGTVCFRECQALTTSFVLSSYLQFSTHKEIIYLYGLGPCTIFTALYCGHNALLSNREWASQQILCSFQHASLYLQ